VPPGDRQAVERLPRREVHEPRRRDKCRPNGGRPPYLDLDIDRVGEWLCESLDLLVVHRPVSDDALCDSFSFGDWRVTITEKSRGNQTVRLFIVARHAECFANISGLMSSDPERPVGLTARGVGQAHQLGAQLANLEIDLAVCSRLLRTQQSVDIALQSRPIPVLIEENFDEVRAGDFDEQPIENYWSWEQQHNADMRLPRGESLDDARLRYATALRRLLARTEPVTLLVIHELALHLIASGAAASESAALPSSFGHALPYLFDEQAIARAVTNIEKLACRRSEGCSDLWPVPLEYHGPFVGPSQ
jgi:broad specificity phosphatase PhoE